MTMPKLMTLDDPQPIGHGVVVEVMATETQIWEEGEDA